MATRQRLIDAALQLFARHGFDGTSVGDVEASAGLQPRRGALYKHFPSKQALLDAAVRQKLVTARIAAEQLQQVDLSDVHGASVDALRPLIQGIGNWFLGEMDQLEGLTRLFEHDADRLEHLRAEAFAGLVDLSYQTAARIIRAVRPAAEDPEADAVLMLAPLVAVRRTTWTYGDRPLGVDDQRLIDRWTDHVVAMLGDG